MSQSAIWDALLIAGDALQDGRFDDCEGVLAEIDAMGAWDFAVRRRSTVTLTSLEAIYKQVYSEFPLAMSRPSVMILNPKAYADLQKRLQPAPKAGTSFTLDLGADVGGIKIFTDPDVPVGRAIFTNQPKPTPQLRLQRRRMRRR